MGKKVTKKVEPKSISVEPEITKLDVITLAKSIGYTGVIDSLYEIEGWVINKFGLYAEIFYSMFHKKWSINNYFVDITKGKKVDWDYTPKQFQTHNEALVIALFHLLKLCK